MTNTPNRIVQKFDNFSLEKASVNMISRIRPMAYGTPIVMADDTTKQPIDAIKYHFSRLASDNNRMISDFLLCLSRFSLVFVEVIRRDVGQLQGFAFWKSWSRVHKWKHRHRGSTIGRHNLNAASSTGFDDPIDCRKCDVSNWGRWNLPHILNILRCCHFFSYRASDINYNLFDKIEIKFWNSFVL